MSGGSRRRPLVVPLLLLALLNTGHASFPSPLLLLALLNTGHASSPAPSPLRDTDPMNGAVALPFSDYYDVDISPTASAGPPPTDVPSSSSGGGGPCDYDPCREPQTPCSELAARSGCLCPGISWNDVPPEPPALTGLARSGSSSGPVTVRWCAPYSYVTAYRVTVGGRELRQGLLGADRRSCELGRVDRETEVCVAAVNDAGVGDGACEAYRPEGGGGGVSLRAGLIGGALGFLLLSSLAVLLWRQRARRRKTEAGRISNTQQQDADTPLESRAPEPAEA